MTPEQQGSHPLPPMDASPSEGGHTALVWSWWASRDEENYNVGPCATRDDVIAEGEDYFDGEEGFYILEAQQDTSERLIPSADDIITRALEQAADDGVFGEDGDYDLLGKPEEQKEALAELDVAISVWAQKWKRLIPTPWSFAAQRNGEWIARATQDTRHDG